MKGKIPIFILLFLIFGIALFFRIYFSYKKVFSDPIKYSADDGIYYMRLVENELLGKHFPHRIYFDPFTYFPKGTYIHFAPLYSQLLAGVVWLASLGKPSLELINKIAPFIPAVLGSLIVFPVFFIARVIWGPKVALLSSLLAVISGPYLYRSLLGNTDHHVAEVFFSTLAMMFLVFALKSRENSENKKFWLFTFLTGFSLGLYFLTWIGALLFLFIVFLFIIFYYFFEYFAGRSANWILLMGLIIFLITLLMIAPFFGHPDLFNSPMYDIRHLSSLLFGILSFLVILSCYILFIKKNWNRKLLPPFLFFLAIFSLIFLKFSFPEIFERIVKTFQGVQIGMVPHELARELVAEMAPLSFQGTLNTFSTLFIFSLIGLFLIFYQFIKERKPEYLLLFIWTIIIMLMSGVISLVGQGRFGYYLSINIALLSSFSIVKGFEFSWQGFKFAKNLPEKSHFRRYLFISSTIIVFAILFFLLFPYPFTIGSPFPANLPDIFRIPFSVVKGGIHVKSEDWYDAMKWLKENTPDPGIDYYGFYQEPGINKLTNKINPYPYPPKAYGILARWDMGHLITYYAHRIPVSNPFQQGIGRKKGEEKELGEVVFFLETEEEKAIDYLDKLGVKYIITDYPDHAKFQSMIKWMQSKLEGYTEGTAPPTAPSKYDNSMIVRLHVLDGRGKMTTREVGNEKIEFFINPLEHFRLIYESKTTTAIFEDSKEEIKEVKIFEYVKGAKIVGQTIPGKQISLSTKIKTNQGREFVWEKNINSQDGYFKFTVPYSQTYQLKIGEKEIQINVSEEDVLEGKEIKILNIK
jgi:dolichyl-diphosphooligosaccharide--protein glycosyltransferase